MQAGFEAGALWRFGLGINPAPEVVGSQSYRAPGHIKILSDVQLQKSRAPDCPVFLVIFLLAELQ